MKCLHATWKKETCWDPNKVVVWGTHRVIFDSGKVRNYNKSSTLTYMPEMKTDTFIPTCLLLLWLVDILYLFQLTCTIRMNTFGIFFALLGPILNGLEITLFLIKGEKMIWPNVSTGFIHKHIYIYMYMLQLVNLNSRIFLLISLGKLV